MATVEAQTLGSYHMGVWVRCLHRTATRLLPRGWPPLDPKGPVILVGLSHPPTYGRGGGESNQGPGVL